MKVYVLNIVSDSKVWWIMIYEFLNGYLWFVCLFLYKYVINYYCFLVEDV